MLCYLLERNAVFLFPFQSAIAIAICYSHLNMIWNMGKCSLTLMHWHWWEMTNTGRRRRRRRRKYVVNFGLKDTRFVMNSSRSFWIIIMLIIINNNNTMPAALFRMFENEFILYVSCVTFVEYFSSTSSSCSGSFPWILIHFKLFLWIFAQQNYGFEWMDSNSEW